MRKFYLNAELNLIQKREMLMEELKRDLQSMAKSLNELTEKTEKMINTLDKLEKTQMAKKTKEKTKPKAARKAAAKKPSRVSASGAILEIVEKSRNGVDTATLKKKTGFNARKIWRVINYLKWQGKIKSTRFGLYEKA